MKDKIIEILHSESWSVTSESGELCTVVEEEDFNDIAERIVELFAIPVVSNCTLEDIKPTGWKCMRCGKDKFTSKQPHNCDTGFRKRNIIWRPIFD